MTNAKIRKLIQLRNKAANEWLACKTKQALLTLDEYECFYIALKCGYGWNDANDFMNAHDKVLALKAA